MLNFLQYTGPNCICSSRKYCVVHRDPTAKIWAHFHIASYRLMGQRSWRRTRTRTLWSRMCTDKRSRSSQKVTLTEPESFRIWQIFNIRFLIFNWHQHHFNTALSRLLPMLLSILFWCCLWRWKRCLCIFCLNNLNWPSISGIYVSA